MNLMIPQELKYTKSHEWARQEKDGQITVGITHHAQELLGDIVFVELPELNTKINVGTESGVVESVKAASDIYTPMSGIIVKINEALRDTPQLINTDPYGEGWLFRVQPADQKEFEKLLTAKDYSDQIAAEEH